MFQSLRAGQNAARFALRNQAQHQLRVQSTTASEVALLEELLSKAKSRAAASTKTESAAPANSGPKFNIGTFNAISSEGLAKFPTDRYTIEKLEDGPEVDIHAVLLRSHKLKSEEIPASVRAIARCGAGTNNIPVTEMTKRGIPVFNTPGANANAVKELTIAALLLASRGVVEGINHVKTIFKEDGEDISKVKARVEKDKKLFVGCELAGKTIGIVGLGHIGTSVANAAAGLGMKVSCN
jgi:D-3-phosphoglycerate dehydrogenase